MTTGVTTGDTAVARPPRTLLLATYTAAIFLSASLLFAVQPMFAKMVLPRLGGAASVWSVAMVFFQAALLAGYAYAHVLTRYVSVRAAILLHVAVMIAAAFMLPLAIAAGWNRPPEFGAALWLLGLFAASIGLPFFALAANSPLLQAWFARSGEPDAHDPYFLYAAGNVGSFLALVSYPFVIEPLVRLGDQGRLWTAGFGLLIVLIAACGLMLWRTPRSASAGALASTPPSWRDVVTWAALAAVPSGLLVAVTAHISTDVAAVPLLWVLPLALYLLTFVIVFQRRPLVPHALALKAQPFLVLLLLVQFIDPVNGIVSAIVINIAAFAMMTLVCHGELARRRPAAEHLTTFYLWMSAGGMLGGIAAALIAPAAFNWVAEYPILIVLAVLCRPWGHRESGVRERVALAVALAATLAVLAICLTRGMGIDTTAFKIVVGVLLAATALYWREPLPFAAIVTTVLICQQMISHRPDAISMRSFFAVYQIGEFSNGRFRWLSNGTTMHGAQRIRDNSGAPVTGRPEVIAYYHDASPMAQAMKAVRARKAGPIDYAVIGLGTGTLACRAEAGDTVRFYEIDPVVVRIARDHALFSYLSECRPDVPIVLGDARLTLAEVPDASYDMIYVDAFNSDAIPMHLLTREAMAIYLRKLKPQGVVVLHISNRHLELASVAAGVAAANGLVTLVSKGVVASREEYLFRSSVAVVARDTLDFGALAQSPDWQAEQPDPQQWVWTDDYSNIIGSLIRKRQP